MNDGAILAGWLKSIAGQELFGTTYTALTSNGHPRKGDQSTRYRVGAFEGAGGQAAVAVVTPVPAHLADGWPLVARLEFHPRDEREMQRRQVLLFLAHLSRTQPDRYPALIRVKESFQISIPVAQLPGYFAGPEVQRAWVWVDVMERCAPLKDGLKAHPNGYDPIESIRLVTPLLRTVGTLHKEFKLIHRDIDEGNALIAKDGTLRLADWGIAHPMAGDNTYTHTAPFGKWATTPPENRDGDWAIGHFTDAWQCGRLIGRVFMGASPFLNDGVEPNNPRLKDLAPEIRGVVEDLCQRDPQIRRLTTTVAAADRLDSYRRAQKVTSKKTGRDEDLVLVSSHGTRIPVHDGFTVGRNPQNSLVLDDQGVSSRHAVFRVRGRKWVVVDRGSTNGTYVNFRPVPSGDGGTELEHGDALMFGRSALLVVLDSSDRTAAARGKDGLTDEERARKRYAARAAEQKKAREARLRKEQAQGNKQSLGKTERWLNYAMRALGGIGIYACVLLLTTSSLPDSSYIFSGSSWGVRQHLETMMLLSVAVTAAILLVSWVIFDDNDDLALLSVSGILVLPFLMGSPLPAHWLVRTVPWGIPPPDFLVRILANLTDLPTWGAWVWSGATLLIGVGGTLFLVLFLSGFVKSPALEVAPGSDMVQHRVQPRRGSPPV